MSSITDFNRIEDCDKIDPLCVNGEITMYLDEDDPVNLVLETSWGDSTVDLTDAVKAAETVTTLYLSPTDDPECLVFEREDGESDCITGDSLSRIISMTLLKNVDQNNAIADGYVYVYDSDTSLFTPYDLATAITNINSAITALQNRVTALETTVSNHETRITEIETLLTPPTDAPDDIAVAWSNINVYSDPTAVINSSGTATTLDKTHGIYSHTLATSVYADEIMG